MSARYYFAWRMFKIAGEQAERDNMSSIRARKRNANNPLLDLTDIEFRRQYRLTKDAFKFLCKELRRLTDLRSSQRVTLEKRFLLHYFSMQLDRTSVQWELQEIYHRKCAVFTLKRFTVKYGMPGVIGCIDCSHFKIFGPPKEEEHRYYCRKHFHSLNVQMVCDDEYRILNVNAKFGGANHDSFIWENSNLKEYMQSLHQNGETVWLLGDSGYPLRPWLMTPILDAAPNSPEANYNNSHMKARVVIENTFGRLKNRWRCLNKDRVLHYKPLKCAKIIQACCVLYNIGLDYGLAEEEVLGIEMNMHEREYDVIQNLESTTRGDESSTSDLLRGRVLRDQLVRRLQH